VTVGASLKPRGIDDRVYVRAFLSVYVEPAGCF